MRFLIVKKKEDATSVWYRFETEIDIGQVQKRTYETKSGIFKFNKVVRQEEVKNIVDLLELDTQDTDPYFVNHPRILEFCLHIMIEYQKNNCFIERYEVELWESFRLDDYARIDTMEFFLYKQKENETFIWYKCEMNFRLQNRKIDKNGRHFYNFVPKFCVFKCNKSMLLTYIQDISYVISLIQEETDQIFLQDNEIFLNRCLSAMKYCKKRNLFPDRMHFDFE